LTMSSTTQGVVDRLRMALITAFGTCCWMSTQPNGEAAAMMNMTWMVCLALSQRMSSRFDTLSSR